MVCRASFGLVEPRGAKKTKTHHSHEDPETLRGLFIISTQTSLIFLGGGGGFGLPHHFLSMPNGSAAHAVVNFSVIYFYLKCLHLHSLISLAQPPSPTL